MISIGDAVIPAARGFHTCAGADVGLSSGLGSRAASAELESWAVDAALRALALAAARATASLARAATASADTDAW